MASGAYSWIHDNNAMHQAEYIYVWVKKDYFAAILGSKFWFARNEKNNTSTGPCHALRYSHCLTVSGTISRTPFWGEKRKRLVAVSFTLKGIVVSQNSNILRPISFWTPPPPFNLYCHWKMWSWDTYRLWLGAVAHFFGESISSPWKCTFTSTGTYVFSVRPICGPIVEHKHIKLHLHQSFTFYLLRVYANCEEIRFVNHEECFCTF